MSLPVSVTTGRQLDAARALSGLIAAIVIIDAITVGAPGLGLVAVPFLVAAFTFTRRRLVPTVLLMLWSALFVAIGVAFVASNGFDAEWGDLLFAYAGTPAAIILTAVLARGLFNRRGVRLRA